jgi:hypothetical protein
MAKVLISVPRKMARVQSKNSDTTYPLDKKRWLNLFAVVDDLSYLKQGKSH